MKYIFFKKNYKRPTMFVSVPRLYNKFYETIKG